MAEEPTYTISQLAELAGVTLRTIRYYTAEGLLPRPDTRGQYALYGEPQLLRLQLIAQLKQTYLPLGEIKARIGDLDDAQIRALLDEQRTALTPPASAADYLAQIRIRQPTRHLAERAEAYTAETPMMSLRPPAAPASAALPYGFATPITAPAAAPPAEEAAAPAVSPQPTSLLSKLMPQHRPAVRPDSAQPAAAPKPAAPQAEQRWRRIELAPGIELHIRESAAPTFNERIAQLIALVHELFEIGD